MEGSVSDRFQGSTEVVAKQFIPRLTTVPVPDLAIFLASSIHTIAKPINSPLLENSIAPLLSTDHQPVMQN